MIKFVELNFNFRIFSQNLYGRYPQDCDYSISVFAVLFLDPILLNEAALRFVPR
jgi:hypothetical protein